MPMSEYHFLDPRRAGLVVRYHTYPTLQQQSVAEHTWQVIRVLWAIWPDVPRPVIQHAMTHDLGELAIGDLPYPSKGMWSDGAKKELDELEKSAILDMCLPWCLPPPPELTKTEYAIFKLAEYIEMTEFAWNEINLGNQYAVLIKKRCEIAIDKCLTGFFSPIPTGIHDKARAYLAKRTRAETEIYND